MKLSVKQSYQTVIQIINRMVKSYGFEQKLLQLQKFYVFHFDIKKSLSKAFRSQAIAFTIQFYRLLLLNMFGERSEQQWKKQIIQVSKNTKHLYCKLMEKLTSLQMIERIQQFLFLITLIGKNLLEESIDSNWRQSEDFEQESVNQFQVEEYIYIVLTFQTIGNLISPKAFKYLKNKHIKKIIFKNSNGTLGIISSLKHIKKHLTTNEQYSGERKTHKENNPGINTSHMLKFIKENLKVKSHYNEKPKAYKDPVVASMGQTFYSNHRKEKKSLKINNQKVSIRQLSRAALNNYELKQKFQRCYKSCTRSPSRFQSGDFPKKLKNKFQMIAQSEEKKDNKKNTKQDWNTLISQLKTESSKNIVKLNQMPIGRVSGKTENEKHRHLQSEPSIHFNVELILKQAYNSKCKKQKNVTKVAEEPKKVIKKEIVTYSFSGEEEQDNKFYNLKLFQQKNLQNKKIELFKPDLWKTSKDLKKKQNQFDKKCKERDLKIKDSFLNLPYKIS